MLLSSSEFFYAKIIPFPVCVRDEKILINHLFTFNHAGYMGYIGLSMLSRQKYTLPVEKVSMWSGMMTLPRENSNILATYSLRLASDAVLISIR